VDVEVFQANGSAERDAALVMQEHIPGTKLVAVFAECAGSSLSSVRPTIYCGCEI
jgi:hypothetical protein